MAANKKQAIEETRIAPRITKVLPVDCRVVELAPGVPSGPGLKKWQRFPARTINVSKTGVLINSDFEIPERTTLELTLHMKMTGEDRQVILLTEVARTRRNAYDIYGRWAMGLKILEIDPKELSLVSEIFLDSSN
jgi:hypothetical protein